MANLTDVNVAAIAEKKFNVTSDAAWEFVADVQAADLKDKEAEGPKEKKERVAKEYIALIVDPNGKIKPTTCFVLQKLPTLHGNTPGLEEEWGMETVDEVIDAIVAEARVKYRKKGPFECLGDVIQFLPAKFLKEYGIKPLSKDPICVMGSNPESLYSNSEDENVINDNVSYMTRN